METINNIEKQYIFQGMRAEFLPKEGSDTPLVVTLRRPDVITTGDQRTIISEDKLKDAYERHCEKLHITVPFKAVCMLNTGLTIRHVIGECGSSHKDHGYARIYCSTSGSTLKPIQTRTGVNVQHALFPLYSDWKIAEVSVEWNDTYSLIVISNIIQDQYDELKRVPVVTFDCISDLTPRYDKFLDAIEAAFQKSRTNSTGPVFYREVKRI